MKFKSVIIVIAFLVLNSCILKSLHPFYTKDSISFQQKFIGEWKDNKEGIWSVKSFHNIFNKEFNLKKTPSKEEQKELEKYKDSYIIEYINEGKKSLFIATPFKIKDQLLLNFSPYIQQDININSLLESHLISTHSAVKFNIVNNTEVNITWLDEERIKDLLKASKIRIKHETLGLNNDFLLTANSNELYEFLKKYLASDIENKWETSSKFKLKKLNVKS